MMEQTPPSSARSDELASAASVGRDLAVADGGRIGEEDTEMAVSGLILDHVAGNTIRYPGEQVTFFTRVEAYAPVPGFEVRIHVPAGFEIASYGAVARDLLPVFFMVDEAPPRALLMLPGTDGEPFPIEVPNQPTLALRAARPAQDMLWRVEAPVAVGEVYEFSVQTLVLPTTIDLTLHSTASLSMGSNGDRRLVASSAASVAVYHKGRYLNHLPALYDQDEFMGRFLMLFESFWRPINEQVSGIDNYWDPDLTPASFLPWLASWFDLTLDDQWEEDQQRELLNSVIWLYRRRGTRAALERVLEIYSREPVEIIERRAKNLNLGIAARLGVGVALGTANQPHTFTVKLRLRPLPRPDGLADDAADETVARLEKKRRHLVEQLIRSGKPAHTSHQLEITVLDAPDAQAPQEMQDEQTASSTLVTPDTQAVPDTPLEQDEQGPQDVQGPQDA